MSQAIAGAEFHALGLGEPSAISSAHGEGVAELINDCLDAVSQAPDLPAPEAAQAEPAQADPGAAIARRCGRRALPQSRMSGRPAAAEDGRARGGG